MKSTHEWLKEPRFQKLKITDSKGQDLDKLVDLNQFCVIIMYCSLDFKAMCHYDRDRSAFINSYKVTDEQRALNYRYPNH